MEAMKLGVLARMDNTGLGNQTYGYYRHLSPTKTLVVDISDLNGNPQFPERYTDNQIGEVTFVKGLLRAPDIDSFLEGLDVVLIAEAPYNYHLYARARELGVKTAVAYNYEFFDWFAHPDYPKPDMLIAPSQWHYQDIEKWCEDNNVKHVYLHCPVDRQDLPFREIKQARTFLHTAGRSAAHDRNGTKTVIEASKYLKTDAQIVIHFQGEQGLAHQTTMTTQDYRQYAEVYGDPSRLNILTQELINYADVYAMGDVLLLPRRYGGNCLPLNEALSIGMPAIMTNVSPNFSFLPFDWLVPAERIGQFEPRTVIDIYGADPQYLADKIDSFYNLTEHEMLVENFRASNLAHNISWDVMNQKYSEALESLCTP
jgi:glycosyltransferase involved in cell wall biosynthesis